MCKTSKKSKGKGKGKRAALLAVILALALGVFAQAAPTFTTGTTTVWTGSTITFYSVNATDGNLFTNTGQTRLLVYNPNDDVCTVTFVTQQTVSVGSTALAVDDQAVSLPALSYSILGPFPTAQFNYSSGANAGRMLVTWSEDSVASCTLRPYR